MPLLCSAIVCCSFYCTSEDPHCESECEAFFPNAKSTLLRLVVPGRSDADPAMQMPAGMFAPKRIDGWTERVDYPHWEELEELLPGAELFFHLIYEAANWQVGPRPAVT